MHRIETALQLQSQARFSEALALWQDLAREAPQDLRVLVPWYRLLGRLGMWDELAALAPTVWSLALAANVDVYRVLANGQGLNAEAGKQLDLLIKNHATNAALQRLRAAVALDVGDHVRAELAVKQLQKLGARAGDLARLSAAIAAFRNDYRSAEACSRKALALADNPRAVALARFGLATALLIQGRMEEGWPHYEWRPSYNMDAGPPSDAISTWSSQGLNGKSILVLREQGAGDLLMVSRWLIPLAERGARVSVVADPRLHTLLARLHPAIELHATTPTVADYHLVAPSMSLPQRLALGMAELPGPMPYLSATAQAVERWRQRLAELPGRKLGLCWAGAPDMVGDPLRSIPPDALAPLGSLADVTWIRLQVGEVAPEFRGSPPFTLIDWTKELDDYHQTAALVSALDGVVSICTSVAHLAGGLGVPTWLLNRANSEWRWLLERDDSPWYPSMRIVRQRRLKEWRETVERLADLLRNQEM